MHLQHRCLGQPRLAQPCVQLLHMLRAQPVESMPPGLQWFAEINPFTIVVDALRALWLGAPAGNNVWGAVVWSLVILGVFAPLAVARYRRTAGQ